MDSGFHRNDEQKKGQRVASLLFRIIFYRGKIFLNRNIEGVLLNEVQSFSPAEVA